MRGLVLPGRLGTRCALLFAFCGLLAMLLAGQRLAAPAAAAEQWATSHHELVAVTDALTSTDPYRYRAFELGSPYRSCLAIGGCPAFLPALPLSWMIAGPRASYALPRSECASAKCAVMPSDQPPRSGIRAV